MAAYLDVFAEHSSLAQLPVRTRRPTVVVADSSPQFLKLVCLLLARTEMVKVVATAGDGPAAVRAVMRHHPDLILMDVQMPTINGVLASAILTAAYPKLAIILMADDGSPQVRAECFEGGAHGFIDKSELSHTLPATLTRVLDETDLD